MRRSQAAALLVLLAGAGLLFLTAGHVPGADGLSAFALGALAGTGALLATRGRGRVAVGVLLLLLGAGAVADVAAAGGLSGWAVTAALGALLLLAGGLLTVLGARAWGALGQRYDAPGAPAAQPRPKDPEVAAWDALDRGEDPTRA